MVGYYFSAGGIHDFLGSPAGGYTTIDVPRADATLAFGVNARDLVGGFFTDSAGIDHGFALSGGVYTTVDVPGALYTHVFGVNDVGQLVGTYGADFDDEHAFLATPVPEPGALVLSGVGLLAAAGTRQTRRR